VTHPYPPCTFTDDYPDLLRIPPEERAEWVAQAEAGIPLTSEQNVRLGYSPVIQGGILIPVGNKRFTSEQLNFGFPIENRKAFIQEIMKLGMERAQAQLSPE
jgi:hypothetical protein